VKNITDRRKTTEKLKPELRNNTLNKTYDPRLRTQSEDNPFGLFRGDDNEGVRKSFEGTVQVRHSAFIKSMGSHRDLTQNIDNSVISGKSASKISSNSFLTGMSKRQNLLQTLDETEERKKKEGFKFTTNIPQQ
jgi:hypothetical protein